MSRGPGRWQRAILEALQTREWIILGDILPAGSGRSARFACRRAAKHLRRAGQVELRWVQLGWYGDEVNDRAQGHMLVLRVGATVEARDLRRWGRHIISVSPKGSA